MTRYLPDVNLWLALASNGHEHHEIAQAWFASLADTDRAVMCRSTQQSLLRLLTMAAPMAAFGRQPLTNREAWAVCMAILRDSRFSLVFAEPPELGEHWRNYSDLPHPSPKRWADAYLAAFARTLPAVFVTIDAAFATYPDLNPLILPTP